jgi:uncharacterized protein
VKIVWDEPKRQLNLAEHGLDFGDLESFDWDAGLFQPAGTSRSGS